VRARLLPLTIGVSTMLGGGTAAVAAESLTPHTAEYALEISILNGKLKTVVTAVGAGYMANSVIEPVGLSRVVARGAIQESSYFLTDGKGVRPEQYRSIDTLSSEDQYVNFDFNWREHTVQGTVNDQPVAYDLNGRVHDRVSIQYQLMLDLESGGASDEYSMLDGDELKLLDVENVGVREVDVPYGEFQAIGIQHRKKDSSRVTTLWCAEELGYLPVVIEQHRDGKLQVRAVLTKYAPATAGEGQPAG
jgi:hypothetical protein